jgi:hypothetical protein
MSIVHCPKCQARSGLIRNAPGPKGFEMRAFQCPKCEFLHTEVVPSDPMGFIDNWANSSLKAPA